MQSVDEAIASHVLSARERAGMSQAELAREMANRGHDFRQQTIYKVETGKRRVTIGEAVDLAASLGIDLDRLIAGDSFAISGEIRAWDAGRKAYQSATREYASTLAALAVAADTKAETELERMSARGWVEAHTPMRVADARWFSEAILEASGHPNGEVAQALVDALRHDREALGIDDG